MRIHSSRVNNITVFGEEKAREIKEEVQALYSDKLKRVIDNLVSWSRDSYYSTYLVKFSVRLRMLPSLSLNQAALTEPN